MSALRARAQRLTSNLWTLIIPPTVWALHFMFCYAYAAIRCAKGGRAEMLGNVRMAIGIATLLALLVVLVSGYIAWAHAQTEGDPPPHDASTAADRLRFLATAKLLLAGLSFIAIVFTALPALIFEDCR